MADVLNNFLDSVKADIAKAGKDQFSPLLGNQGTADSQQYNPLTVVRTLNSMASANQINTSIMSRGLRFSYVNQEDWNRVFPYRFMIVEYVRGKYQVYRNLALDLPITPQEMMISAPFANTLTVTSRGILEESNGMPLRNISFTATTGVMVKRPSFALTNPDKSLVGTVFGGTLAAVSNLQAALSAVAGSNIPENDTQLNNDETFFSGYYQYHLLKAFLEAYADLKAPKGKAPEDGRRFRLALQVAKDKSTYILSPEAFDTRRSAAAPLEYVYTFRAIGWGSIPSQDIAFADTDQGPRAGSQLLSNDVGNYQRALNTIRNMRGVVQRAKDVVTAVKTDIDVSVIGPMNNVILFLKELISVPATIADLPREIQNSLQQNVIRQSQDLFEFIPPNQRNAFQASVSASTTTSASNAFDPDVATDPSVLNDIDITDSINLDAIQMTTEQQQAVDTARLDSLLIDNGTVEALADQIQQTVDNLEAIADDQGEDSPVWQIMYSMQESQQELFGILSSQVLGPTSGAEQQAGVTPLIDFYKSTTAAFNIDFVTPRSKYAIPFPFRSTLEQLSALYLGDALRWNEIAVVNNLKPPYIDEDGFVRPFLSNGAGRQLNVESIENLYVNQAVLVGSNTLPARPRKIRIIQKISDSNWLITLDGAEDLGQYTTNDEAYLKGFLPNTVNSQKMIFIPLDTPPNIDATQTKPLPWIDEDPGLLRLSKIDILLDSNGDIASSQDGTWNLAFGKANLIQAATLKFRAASGKVLLHPTYGAGVEVGESQADFSVQDVRDRIVDNFKRDERFGGVNQLLVKQEEDAVEIQADIQVSETQTTLPISFKVGE